MAESPQVNSKLIKLERKISAVANQIRGKTNRSGAFRRKGLTTPRFANLTKQKLAAVAAFCRNRGIAIAVWIRKLIDAAIRGASFSAKARSKRPIPALERPASPNRRVSEDVGNVAVILVCACLGLVSVCAIVDVVLLVQIRELKTDMAQMGYEFAATKARVNQLENVTRQISNEQSEAASNRNVAKAQLKQPPLILGNADIQIVRQFIKVAPPPLGVQAKLSVGDDIAQLTASPIPISLADALPKLRGASFSIDQDGSIIIIGAGSNRIDAVIPYR
jgi:hypothetical protein